MRRYMWAVVVNSILALPGNAADFIYNCAPVELRELEKYFRVECGSPSNEGGYPRDGADSIIYFAVQKASPAVDKAGADFAKRFVHVMHTAITAGLVVQFKYTSGDTSGASWGCTTANNCRKPWAFGLLAPATAVRVPYVE